VPRKLIRLLEALRLRKQMVEKHPQPRVREEWDIGIALRVLALQQLYPPLYRLVRFEPGHFVGLFALQKHPLWDYPFYPEGENKFSLKQLQEEENKSKSNHQDDVDQSSNSGDSQTSDNSPYSRAWRRQQLQAVHQCMEEQRSANDPLALFKADKKPDILKPEIFYDKDNENPSRFACLYLQHLPISSLFDPAPSKASQELAVEATEKRITSDAKIADVKEVLASLDRDFRARTISSWRGKRLPEDVLETYVEHFNSLGGDQRVKFLQGQYWLQDLSELLDNQQLVDFYRECQVLELLASHTTGQD